MLAWWLAHIPTMLLYTALALPTLLLLSQTLARGGAAVLPVALLLVDLLVYLAQPATASSPGGSKTMRIALIQACVVINVIEASMEFAAATGHQAVASDCASPGDTYDGAAFTRPADPPAPAAA